jgi:hypothetical protein
MQKTFMAVAVEHQLTQAVLWLWLTGSEIAFMWILLKYVKAILM